MAKSDVNKLSVHAGDTYDIETESLDAHVAICSERYFAIHQHLQESEVRLSQKIEINSAQISRIEKVVIWSMGAIFITLLGSILAVILK
jgi:cell division protein FtsL